MAKLKHPVSLVLTVYLMCYIFRIIEYFLIRTDKTFWGEAFLHKLAGIAILFITVKLISYTLESIGFVKTNIFRHLFAGLLFGLAVFALAYGIEILIAMSKGDFKSLQWYISSYAVDGNIGNRTGITFFLICIAGNIINVIMEEGVFRGLFQKILQQRFSFILSVLIAAALFGFWHVIGPIRNYYDDTSSMGGMIANICMLVITTGLGSIKFALLTKLTGSLYMAMGDHFVNNTIINMLHVVSESGADQFMFIRITIAQTLAFFIVLFTYIRKRRHFS